ncbi:unnamed protein product [Urochloa humidicola]
MQKEIAQELRLDRQTMSMFDEQDEEDDFSGVDLGSRDAIRGVATVIDRNLRESRFMMIFINGSDEEVGLGKLGIPENSYYVILWTFSRRLVTMRYHVDNIAEKLRYTDVFLYTYGSGNPPSSQSTPLFREEAANIVARNACMRGMDLARVVDCCLYGLLLKHHSLYRTTGFPWPAHAPNYWICDGIIPGGRAREISNALHSEISFECHADVFDYFFRDLTYGSGAPFLVLHRSWRVNYEKRPYRWLSVNFLLNERAQEEIWQTVLAGASSVFLAFEREHNPLGLPDGFFKQCRNLGVLALSCCAFSFVSPPFLECHTLRFLGLDHCTDNSNAVELGGGGDCATSSWAFLKSVWVMDLYYTHWVEILSEEKIELMANLMELNIEGVRWPPWTSSHHLQKRLPNLQRLRIIRPTYDEASSAETSSSDSFLMDNTSLEILDLSGSKRVMGGRDLAAGISKASHLEVLILDGCDVLGDVVLPNNSSLRSFSLDGYGPASSHRTSTVELPPQVSRPQHPPTDDSSDNKKDIAKTSVVSLQGCRRLDKLFLRGLPNLEELDLSGCAIKVLDFEAMVVDVPMLKRLFLLGCERLCAIKWSYGEKSPNLRLMDMICIDTRPGSGSVPGYARRPPSLGGQSQKKYCWMHATTADARLARSLWALVSIASYGVYFFNIRITSSGDVAVEPADEATTSKEMMIGSDDQRQHCCTVRGGLLYSDVFAKVGDGPAPMLTFPQPPTRQRNRHIEIGVGSRSVQSETTEQIPQINNLASLMSDYTKSLHVHHVSTCTSAMPAAYWYNLRWCRVESCPSLQFVFPPGALDYHGRLETIWVSDLLMARCIWSKGKQLDNDHFGRLQHLHLRRCPSLWFALAMGSRPSFPSLETLHIIHCGDLRHIFVSGLEEWQHTSVQHTSVEFPKLTTIHLHDLPALQQMCEAAVMVAPKLKTIKIRGCWSLRRLPALKGRKPGKVKKPSVEVEKDVWDALEWDGVDAGHHPSLYEAPVHSRYYKRSRLLRGTVLR